ncbi:hypothetical protein PAGU1678_22880 [Paraclostridium bifermentans subsp. muricolitidis]|nr:hypothetical protein PAGU1678_22880 [Paraclostridium bifermentans subsp. muricolitidis]
MTNPPVYLISTRVIFYHNAFEKTQINKNLVLFILSNSISLIVKKKTSIGGNNRSLNWGD